MLTERELLAACKRQPRLERRHATFKGVIAASPLELKSDYRIDAFGFCLYVALLVHALIERELRRPTPGSASSRSTTRIGPTAYVPQVG
jgi:transposase